MTLIRNLTGTNPSDDAPNVEDVFSTYLYDGTGSAKTIINGINLSTIPSSFTTKPVLNIFDNLWPQDLGHDSLGNIFVAGYSDNNPTSGSSTLRLFKIASNNTVTWAKSYDLGTLGTSIAGIVIDSSNNIILAGKAYPSGANDSLIVKFDGSDGSIIWEKTLDSGTNDTLKTIALDQSDNVVIGGGKYNTNAYIAKINGSTGAPIWEREINLLYNGAYVDIEITSVGDIYACGYCKDNSSSTYDGFLAKYDTDGTIQWQRRYGNDSGVTQRFYALALDASENIYCVGKDGTANKGMFVKYSSSGSLLINNEINTQSMADPKIVFDGTNIVVGDDLGYIVKYSTTGTILLQRHINRDLYTSRMMYYNNKYYFIGRPVLEEGFIIGIPDDLSGFNGYNLYQDLTFTTPTLVTINGTSALTSSTSTFTTSTVGYTFTSQTGNSTLVNDTNDYKNIKPPSPGDGGMVWTKARQTASVSHAIFDTERGIGARLFPNDNTGEYNDAGYITSFNSDGWSMGGNTETNLLNEPFVSWTFKKSPRFFDVVTYTGNSTAGREIAHDLGCDVGMIIVKKLTSAAWWRVIHRNGGAWQDLILDTNYGGSAASDNFFGGGSGTSFIPPTTENFTLGDSPDVNSTAVEYVAYLFAHDPVGEDNDGMIACGSYTGDGTDQTISLGWEPQYVLVKNTTTGGQFQGWLIMDSMRGLDHSGGGNATLTADNSGAEGHVYGSATYDLIKPIASGFIAQGVSGPGIVGTNGDTYIYMAIRAPMMVEPEAGTEVFAVDNSNSSDIPAWTSGFPVDMVIEANTTGGNKKIHSRLTGARAMETDVIGAEVARVSAEFDYSDGFYSAVRSSTEYAHMFKRAKGFFDVVAYTGNGTAGHTVNHSLSVAPEMMWVKCREQNRGWMIYHSDLGSDKYIQLHVDDSSSTLLTVWNDTVPTTSTFTLGTYGESNVTNATFISYLFASLAGVSKVGSYTGNGSSQNIACGFSNGARFVLIKRTDSTGDWYIWDTTRGIVAGNDPHLALNTTAQAEVTTDDSIDPYSTGFTVNQVAATNVNVTNGTYIFLAIA